MDQWLYECFHQIDHGRNDEHLAISNDHDHERKRQQPDAGILGSDERLEMVICSKLDGSKCDHQWN